MVEIQDVIHNLRLAIKRRRTLLIVTPLLFLGAAALALQFIEPKFRSSTTLLVQQDQILNPLVMYNMSENRAPGRNRYESLNDIVYSRSTLELLIDSLNLNEGVTSAVERQQLVQRTQSNIRTVARASDAFEISFTHTDPLIARAGTEILANHFMQTKQSLETRRHEEAVQFFTAKLNDLETVVDEQRNQAIQTTSVRLRDLPDNAETLQARLQTLDESLGTLDWQIFNEEQRLRLLEQFHAEPTVSEGVRHLFKLNLAEIQYGDELTTALDQYEELQQQYTESYPLLLTQASRVQQIAERIQPGIQLNLERLQTAKVDLQAQRSRIVENMQQFFVANQQATTQQSSITIYEELYNDMKVNLEQARMALDVGRNAANQFSILVLANTPEKPVSPNKTLILGIGLFLGLISGTGASILAELMDSTIRHEKDIPVEKPIIAYLTNG